MSKSRYTQAELNEWADRVDETQPGAHWAPVTVADMLRQAAQDARVIEQIRAWLRHEILKHGAVSLISDPVRRATVISAMAVLAELDRLTAPQRPETT